MSNSQHLSYNINNYNCIYFNNKNDNNKQKENAMLTTKVSK